MTACTVQSVELHRESVDNLHQVVDVNVKVRQLHTHDMYQYPEACPYQFTGSA